MENLFKDIVSTRTTKNSYTRYKKQLVSSPRAQLFISKAVIYSTGNASPKVIKVNKQPRINNFRHVYRNGETSCDVPCKTTVFLPRLRISTAHHFGKTRLNVSQDTNYCILGFKKAIGNSIRQSA